MRKVLQYGHMLNFGHMFNFEQVSLFLGMNLDTLKFGHVQHTKFGTIVKFEQVPIVKLGQVVVNFEPYNFG